MRRGFLALMLVVVVAGQATAAPRAIGVIDGDTLEVDGRVVQLYGIDAPELGQLCDSQGTIRSCGVDAALALRKLVTLDGQRLNCEPWRDDPADVRIAGAPRELCRVGHEDVALVLLHGGHAVALPGSFPDYLEAQEQARQARLGIWHSEFAMPWHWREATGGSDRQCNVKGVGDAADARRYVVPTDPDYRETPGERLFCSDEEARAAGLSRGPAR